MMGRAIITMITVMFITTKVIIVRASSIIMLSVAVGAGDEVREAEASEDGKRRSKKHKKHHKKEKRDRSSRREPDLAPAAPPQHPQDRR